MRDKNTIPKVERDDESAARIVEKRISLSASLCLGLGILKRFFSCFFSDSTQRRRRKNVVFFDASLECRESARTSSYGCLAHRRSTDRSAARKTFFNYCREKGCTGRRHRRAVECWSPDAAASAWIHPVEGAAALRDTQAAG